MERTAGHRSETDLEFVIDSTRCGAFEKDGEGAWLITLYFAIKNLTDTTIRITNLNGKVEYDTRDSHPALTLGSREVIDLTTKDPLLREGRYYDLAPNEEQSISGLLEIVNWFRGPSNRVDATYALLISLSADYRVIETDQTLSVTIPALYCFQSIEPDAPSDRSSAGLACITEHNLEELFELNKDNDEILEILGEARKRLRTETTRAELIWPRFGPIHRPSRWKRLVSLLVSRSLAEQIIAGLVVLAIVAVVGYLIHLV